MTLFAYLTHSQAAGEARESEGGRVKGSEFENKRREVRGSGGGVQGRNMRRYVIRVGRLWKEERREGGRQR